MTRSLLAVIFLITASIYSAVHAAEPAKYLRIQVGDKASYGLLEGDRVRELQGDIFGEWQKTDTTHALKEVKLLPPTVPTQVLALAGNYRSHVGGTVPPKYQIPQPFHKGPSCLVGDGDAIVLPSDSRDVHYEAELVIVIGRKCSKVPKEKALKYVFGVTAGNDISERIWQNDEAEKDLQWWRAKGADTFGPVGPYIATGIDYGNLDIKLHLNGEVKQEDNTSAFIHDIPTVVSFISKYVTLYPGDLIFTGTPGTTTALKPGDVIEVELEGVGVLRNPVVAEIVGQQSTDSRDATHRRGSQRAQSAADAKIAKLVQGLAFGTKAEYERIPAIWQVAIDAGKRNDEAELKQLLDRCIPRLDRPAQHWEVVVIGGGIVNGLSQQNVWPGARIEELLNDKQMMRRWRRLVDLSAQMADDDSVPSGTRYDALRILGAEPFSKRGAQLVRYLESKDAELQMGAVSGLSDMDSPEAAKALLAAMPHYNEGNRKLAIDALLRTNERRAGLQKAINNSQLDASMLTLEQSYRLETLE